MFVVNICVGDGSEVSGWCPHMFLCEYKTNGLPLTLVLAMGLTLMFGVPICVSTTEMALTFVLV